MDGEGDPRRFRRREPKEGVFAHLRSSEEIVGRITDISPAGLGFEYVDLGERMRTRQARGNARVGMLIRGNGFLFEELPCRVVYDITVPRDRVPVASQLDVRRCGIEFHADSKDILGRITSVLSAGPAGVPPFS